MTGPESARTPFPDAAALAPYDEVIELHGVRVPFVPAIITPPIERPLRSGRYEKGERLALRATLRPGDRVLELGAGIGLLSTVAALTPGVETVVAVEANPALVPLIRETHRLSGVAGRVAIENAVASAGDAQGGTLPFYLRRDFRASSMEPDSRAFQAVVEVPQRPVSALLAQHRPTVIVCDIEGAELALFEAADLAGVRAVAVKLHAKIYGKAGADRIARALRRQGLFPQSEDGTSSVELFLRDDARAAAEARAGTGWPPEAPRFLIAACMKNEGPFLLEWVAWQRAIGVSDLLVFTNDCTDGTDLLLGRLDDLGVLRHMPNPAILTGSSFFQPTALTYVQQTLQFRRADFFISLDSDEYINVRVGAGRLDDLIAATGPFDVLSLYELNHGCNGQEAYRRGWLKDLFPRHQTERPGVHKSRRGIKSIVRLGPAIEQISNHRPLTRADAVWLDGSGRPTRTFIDDSSAKGGDCRAAYDLALVDHYALRSLNSYLVKMHRGDAVIEGKRVSNRYWRMRNRNEARTSTFGPAYARARAEYDRLIADADVARLHEACCAAHEARIAELLVQPDYIARRRWILENAWEDAMEPAPAARVGEA
jgi:FkbM family methyltransferase